MKDIVKLELEFFTPSSYIFSCNYLNKEIEVHIHIGHYKVMHIAIVICDLGILIQKDRNFINYIDKLMLEIDSQLGNIFGLLTKNNEIETYFHVNFNSLRFNFPPCFIKDSDEDYKNLKHNLSKIIFDKIKSIEPNQIY
ncbi:hypothetical protein FC758_01305 [Clostridium botulinum]|nr:hypothetical protein [Clostridium botulinum]